MAVPRYVAFLEKHTKLVARGAYAVAVLGAIDGGWRVGGDGGDLGGAIALGGVEGLVVGGVAYVGVYTACFVLEPLG